MNNLVSLCNFFGFRREKKRGECLCGPKWETMTGPGESTIMISRDLRGSHMPCLRMKLRQNCEINVLKVGVLEKSAGGPEKVYVG